MWNGPNDSDILSIVEVSGIGLWNSFAISLDFAQNYTKESTETKGVMAYGSTTLADRGGV